MASVMEWFNATSTASPDVIEATIASSNTGFMTKVLDNVNGYSIFFTLLGLAIAYDQSTYSCDMLVDVPR